MKYIYLKTDGTKRGIETDTPLSLEDLQELVGGYIEFFEYNDREVGCCNEEGLMKNLPLNPHITDKDILGDVVIGRFEYTDEDRIFVGV